MQDNSDHSELIAVLSDVKKIGRYQIVRELGHGASGVVFQGYDPYVKRYVAIKVSQPKSDRAIERFFTEAQYAGQLNHQNLVSIYDVGIYEGLCYIAMQYVDGTTLKKYCLKDNLLPIKKVVEVVFNVSNAIDYSHRQNIIHRDIKPSNIMLDKKDIPKITDFGIAQMTKETSELGVWGTPSYMPPEHFKEEPIGYYSDVFSLGCVLYELLTGEMAFSGKSSYNIMYKVTNEEPASITELRPECPSILVDIIQKALQKDPAKRYQTCSDMSYDLRVALRGLTEKFKDDKIEDIANLALQASFFENFSQEQVIEILLASAIIESPKGKVIVAEGEIDDTLFVLLNGRTKVMKCDQEISCIEAGECFGEMAYICGQPRSATVMSDTNCTLLKISSTLMDKSPTDIQIMFYKNFAKTLVNRFSP